MQIFLRSSVKTSVCRAVETQSVRSLAVSVALSFGENFYLTFGGRLL